MDIYALGTILYQMLTGHLPFEHKQSIMELLAAHLSAAPPEMKTWGVDVPPVLEAATLRALAKSPSDRFSSCQEFSLAFVKALDLFPSTSTFDNAPPLNLPSGELFARAEPTWNLPPGKHFRQDDFDRTTPAIPLSEERIPPSISLWTWGIGLALLIFLGTLMVLFLPFLKGNNPRISQRESTPSLPGEDLRHKPFERVRVKPRNQAISSIVLHHTAPTRARVPSRELTVLSRKFSRKALILRKKKFRPEGGTRTTSLAAKQRCYQCAKRYCESCASGKSHSIQGMPTMIPGNPGSQL